MAAQVPDFFARSISGHATVEMHQLYSSQRVGDPRRDWRS